MICQSRPYHFKFFKGCLPQMLLGPFLNTLTQMIIRFLLIIHGSLTGQENEHFVYSVTIEGHLL